MTFDQFFEPKARWKHREREFVIFIREVIEPGKYRLSFVDLHPNEPFAAGAMDLYIISGIWTAEDLVRDFEPLLLAPTRYDRIADDDLFDDDPEETSP